MPAESGEARLESMGQTAHKLAGMFIEESSNDGGIRAGGRSVRIGRIYDLRSIVIRLCGASGNNRLPAQKSVEGKMKKLLLITVFMMTMPISQADAFTLPFDDLAIGTDVLNSYDSIEGITFTTGLYVIDDGAYSDPDRGARIQEGTTVTMTIPQGTDLLSFYFNGSAMLNAYGSDGELVFQGTPVYLEDNWLHYGENFISTVYQVTFVVSSGEFSVDPITNEGMVVPEPATMLLFGISMAGLAVTRIGKK